MSPTVELLVPQEAFAPPTAKPLDEAVWNTWVAKGYAEDRHARAAFVKGVKCVAIAGLLTVAVLWSHLGPFDLAVRFIVAAGAMVVMVQAFHAKHYAIAAVFGALALLYNPVAPAFSFSGDWQRAVVLASALPFVASLAWPSRTPANK